MPVVDFRDPVKARAGRLGAAARWGPRRVVRLDELTTAQRGLVLALIAAARAQNTNEEAVAVVETPATAISDGAGHARPTG